MNCCNNYQNCNCNTGNLSENNDKLKRELGDFVDLLRERVSDIAYDKNYENILNSIADVKLDLNNAIDESLDIVNTAVDAMPFEDGVLDDTFVTATANGVGTVARNQRDKNSDSVSVKDFGAKCDGIADDTAALKSAVAYCMNNRRSLELMGNMLITDEVVINKHIIIYGNGVRIKYNNMETDAEGNATKCLFRFQGYLAANQTKISSIDVTFISTVPHQHALIYDNSYIIDHDLYDISVWNCTGCIMWHHGDGQSYNPAFHNPKWDSIRGFNIGGLIGRSPNAKTWVSNGFLTRWNLENAINPISPSHILADCRGFRNVHFDNWIIEGNGGEGTRIGLSFSGEKNHISRLYNEVTKYPFDKFLDIYGSCTVNGIFDKENRKITVTKGYSEFSGLDIGDLSELLEGSDSFVSVKNSHSFVNYNTGNLPYVPNDKIGRLFLDKQASNLGVLYSQNKEYEVFNIKDGLYKTASGPVISRSMNGFNTKLTPPADATISPIIESGVGRVYRLQSTTSTPNMTVGITVPPEFFGSQLILSVRYRINYPEDVTATYNIHSTHYGVAGIGKKDIGSNGDLHALGYVNRQMKRNEWTESHILVGNVVGNLSMTIFQFIGLGGRPDITIDISDIKAVIGHELPELVVNQSQPTRFKDLDMPAVPKGAYIVGDTIEQLPTATVAAIRRCITGGGSSVWMDITKPNTLASGSTASRPTTAAIGFQYFDTTLSKPVFYAGSGWVDSTGAVV